MKLVKSLSLTFLLVTLSRGQIDFGATDRAEDERLQGVIEELCKNRPPNEYFRLSTESNCRDAVRCVQNDFAGGHTLAAVRCPTGLVFDLYGQTCNWAAQVKILKVWKSFKKRDLKGFQCMTVIFDTFWNFHTKWKKKIEALKYSKRNRSDSKEEKELLALLSEPVLKVDEQIAGLIVKVGLHL